MGTWFRRIRKGSAAQVRAYRDAHKALWRNPDREETPRYLDLNSRAYATRAPLSRVQQEWHFQGALREFDREQPRARKAARHRVR